jgi:hypothetical protein
MAVRTTMASLITSVRLLINDPSSTNFSDQEVQDVMDEGARFDYRYLRLIPSMTYQSSSYLDYYSNLTHWEDDITFWQWRITQVYPSLSENISAHWSFAMNTTPPVMVIGKSYDTYRAAADLLERLAARWLLSYNVTVDGQSLQRSQAAVAIQMQADKYRRKQRATTHQLTRGDITGPNDSNRPSLAPISIDYGRE